MQVDWRTLLATEPPERYVGFGRPILSPGDGVVVRTHDGEDDHAGRRSQLALIPYALGQCARLRAGVSQVAGNHVVIALRDDAFVALVHLRRGSLRVAVGDTVLTGQVLAECGNSGNSTQPHVHVQVTDGPDMTTARARPDVVPAVPGVGPRSQGARRPGRRGTGRAVGRRTPAAGVVVRSGAMGWWDAMSDDAANPQDERTERAHYHVAEQQRRDARESAKAQVFIDRFVERAIETGLPTEELTAAPWSGRGRYRTGSSGGTCGRTARSG